MVGQSAPAEARTWPIVLVASVSAVALVLFAVALVVFLWPWRVEISAKAMTNASAISVAAGLGVAGVSASIAAIFNGPGVVAVHFRGRQLYRRNVPKVSLEALLDWLDKIANEPKGGPTRLSRLKDWVIARTDVKELPELGVRVALDLRDPTINGSLACGFSDPATTGKAAAILYPIAGVLAPLGAFDIELDWSGRTRVDGAIEVSFGVVVAKVTRALLGFLRNHFHLRKKAPTSSTIVASSIL